MATSPFRQRASTPSTPLLSTFQKHIEDMRNLVLCKICIKPLYEPYNLGCGHTYCYTCLSNWFGGANRRKRKTCPDCRAQVMAQPSPNYLLRDLVHMFVSRIELLPEDETTDEHHEAKCAEASGIDSDKGPGGEGLFKGAFNRQNAAHVGPPRAIRDNEDGVYRCPMCTWELEDGACLRCGYNDSDEDDSDESDDTRALPSPSIISIHTDLDGDLEGDDYDQEDEYDEDDGFVDDGFVHPDRRANITRPPRLNGQAVYRNGHLPQMVDHDEPLELDEEYYEEEEEQEPEEDEEPGHPFHALYQGAYDEEGDEEASDGNITAVPDGLGYDSMTNDDDESMDPGEGYSEDESEVNIGARRQHRGRMPQPERDETPSVTEPASPGSFYADALAAGDAGFGFSPTRSMSPIAAGQGRVSQRSAAPYVESDEDAQVIRQRRAAATSRIPRRPARVVISSDEESDESTPTPPRPVAERRRHLRNQVARRGARVVRGGNSHRPNGVWDANRHFREAARR